MNKAPNNTRVSWYRNVCLLMICLLILALPACNSCNGDNDANENGDEHIRIPTLDRNIISGRLGSIIPINEDVVQDPQTELHILVDNREAMGRFLSIGGTDTLYSVALEALGGERLRFKDTIAGYFLLDILRLEEYDDFNTINHSAAILRDAQNFGNYSAAFEDNWNYSIVNGLNALLNNTIPINANQLFVVISDLAGVTELDSLVNVMLNDFVHRRDMNVGIIALRAEYRGDITNLPQVVPGNLDRGAINPLSPAGRAERTFDEQFLNQETSRYGEQVINRPVYIIIMGGTDLVRSYMDSVAAAIRSHSFYRDRPELIETLRLDDFPNVYAATNDQITMSVTLSSAFEQYTELNILTDPNALAILSPSVGGRWDDYLTDGINSGNIPFWRIWNDMPSHILRQLSLTIELPSNANISFENINIHYFLADSSVNNDNGMEISDNVRASVSHTAFGLQTDNEYIRIVERRSVANGYIITLELRAGLERDRPLLFLIDTSFVQSLGRPVFNPISLPTWVNEWGMNLVEYRDYAYPTRNERGAFVFIRRGYFYGAERTLFLEDFADQLLNERQRWIERVLAPVTVNLSSYTLFGFVARGTYMEDYLQVPIDYLEFLEDSIQDTLWNDGQFAFPLHRFRPYLEDYIRR